MSDIDTLSRELAPYAGEMAPLIVKKVFSDMRVHGETIPSAMRKKVVDTILERMVFDKEKHHSLRRELMHALRVQNC